MAKADDAELSRAVDVVTADADARFTLLSAASEAKRTYLRRVLLFGVIAVAVVAILTAGGFALLDAESSGKRENVGEVHAGSRRPLLARLPATVLWRWIWLGPTLSLVVVAFYLLSVLGELRDDTRIANQLGEIWAFASRVESGARNGDGGLEQVIGAARSHTELALNGAAEALSPDVMLPPPEQVLANLDALVEAARRYERGLATDQELDRRVRAFTADAEDVAQAQESFVRAYLNLGKFREGEPFRPWLLRIVTNLARNELRARGRRQGLLARAFRLAAPSEQFDPGPERAAEAGERRQLVLSAIKEPPMDDRVVLYLRHFLGMPEREIAVAIGKRPGTVKSRLNRASKRLREVIEQGYPALRPAVVSTGGRDG